MSCANVSLLKNSGSTPLGYTNTEEGNQVVYLSKAGVYEEITTNFSTTSLTNPAGNLVRVELAWGPSDQYRIDNLFFQFEVTNSDASNSLTLFNPFYWISRLRVLINRTEVLLIDDPYKETCTVSLALRKHSNTSDDFYNYLITSRTENGATLSGETYTSSAVMPVSLNLLTLCPWLNQLIPNVGVQFLAFEISFMQNYGSYATNNLYSYSGSTGNPNSTNLTLNNIRLKQGYVRYNDGLFYQPLPLPQLYVIDKFETKTYNQSWNGTSDQLLIDISQAFGKHKRCMGISLIVQNAAAITAYNDSTHSAIFYSGWKYVSYLVKLNSRTIIDMLDTTGATDRQHERRRLGQEINMRRFNSNLFSSLMTYSDKASKVFLPMTYIDFSNIDLDANCANFGGIDNTFKSYEITFAGTANGVGASCIVTVCLHYQEIATIDANGTVNLMS